MEKIRVGVSSCLLGNKVRYDGGHKQDRFVKDVLGVYFEYVPVCPEVEFGLPIPREAMRLVGTPEAPRLKTIRSGIDYTEGMLEWAARRAEELEKEQLCGFIFKSRSPSSGMQGVKVYSESGMPSRTGRGLFADTFMKRFSLIPVEDDGRLNDPPLRENFIERVFVFARWRELERRGPTPRDLVEFHASHKLLIMAHSPKHVTTLGRLTAGSVGARGKVKDTYIATLMEGLRLLATARKNTNVLQHIMGYFKKELTGDEKEELLEVIGNYHRGVIPLIVPVTLLAHYVRKYDQPYLKRQHYLHPHPMELMLRNHV